MPTIEIQAIDTLFFRDGKPFEMGDDNWAEGIFPPPPSVFYGALRSAYFSEHPEQLDLANTENDPTKDLKITGIYLKINNGIYLQAPSDYVYNKEKSYRIKKREVKNNGFTHELLNLKTAENINSNYKLEYLCYSEKNIEKYSDVVIHIDELQSYFSGDIDDKILKRITLLKFVESKIGIGINNGTNTTSEGKLFRLGMQRLETKKTNINFVVSYEFSENFIPKLLKFGAENKVTLMKEYTNDIIIKNEIDDFFKVYILTPTISSNGWNINLENKITSGKIKLISASIDKHIKIGGFDVKGKEPKFMYKAIPAGSIFFYKIIEGDKNKILKELQDLNNLNNFNKETANKDDYIKAGFGLFKIGKINKNQFLK
jgi:CRISPR-associated protein Cmr3